MVNRVRKVSNAVQGYMSLFALPADCVLHLLYISVVISMISLVLILIRSRKSPDRNEQY